MLDFMGVYTKPALIRGLLTQDDRKNSCQDFSIFLNLSNKAERYSVLITNIAVPLLHYLIFKVRHQCPSGLRERSAKP